MRLATGVLCCLALTACGGGEVTMDNAWVRAAPPGSEAMAAYLDIENGTRDPVTVTAVASPWFRHAMIHATVVNDGVARMVHENTLTIAAGETVRLAPGGRHLMLMGPDRPIVEGMDVPLSLTLDDGRSLGLLAPVRSDR